jgi:hypothetical protein
MDSLQRELSKLLREQQDAIDNHSDPLVIERNNQEIWALRNKYACGSTWGKDAAFDKWWVKQVAKARNLNVIKQIFGYIAVVVVLIFILVLGMVNKQADQWAEDNSTPPDEEHSEYAPDESATFPGDA